MRLILGIDGGATSTKAALSNPEGQTLAVGDFPMMLPCFIPEMQVKRFLNELIDSMVSRVGAQRADISGICLGMSGCDRPKERETLEALVQRLLPDTRVVVVNDAIVALTGGAGKPEGIVVISGTGSITYGCTAECKIARAGGGGTLISDEGSGFEIGRSALKAVFRAGDGRGSPTLLEEKVLSHLDLGLHSELILWARDHAEDKPKIASLATLVFQAADEDDGVAQSILVKAAAELALAASAVGKRLWDEKAPIDVVMAGSVFENQALLQNRFKSFLHSHLPEAKALLPERSGAEGACAYGLHVWGRDA